ncbi:unnamed protein product [Phytomonas sp. EM1]|nr:unnamed protein product [Phytomonas sp. EM1]|eukprot:CCW61375.1 unnamed protein product [Phytomonas sp. isolate EM1]
MTPTRLKSGSRTGWLFNYHSTTEVVEIERRVEEEGTNRAALVLLFQDHAGDTFSVNLHYNPYIMLLPVEGHERDVELGLMAKFGPQLIHRIEIVEKEDLDLINHLSGRRRLYMKVVFQNVQDLTTVRSHLSHIVQRNNAISSDDASLWKNFSNVSLREAMAKPFEEDLFNAGPDRWTEWVQDMREYDVKYYMRVAIDMKVFCGLWYDVTVTDGETSLVRCDDSKYAPAMPRVVAFDIETTKAPLRFPQPEVDQIYMISYILDGRGYLIVNREIVTEDIHPFEYTPRPEYEGHFETFNEPDEAGVLRRFFSEMNIYQPNVYVTYNGDYFDFPFIHARALFHRMNMRKEIGFSQGADGAFLNQQIPHLDCFYWVKRDSYLPQGSQGLKAVTRAKLGFDPIEVDPEDMLPLAQTQPQRMASYSVSDAVSTWYLYQKYIHPFIYSLATIIPMPPDDVLRKGSGGLCEALLMVKAEANNVIFPNKKEMQREQFYDGHLIDTETYIGGRVEALRSGVYRADLPLAFNLNSATYQNLINDLDDTLRFTLENENHVKVEEVTNMEEVRAQVIAALTHLRDHPKQQEKPVIYHLDVGAMYPNVILTNRLQPYSIPSPDVCAGCCFNSPNNEYGCKRVMSWKWRGELFTAGRYEFQRVKAQLENESFAAAAIEQANLSAVQKKTYGNRKGNVLEGTAYEQRSDWRQRRDGERGQPFGAGGYRKGTKLQQREAAEAFLPKETTSGKSKGDGADADSDHPGDDSDEEGGGNGLKSYQKLSENTQFSILKKRMAEYSRKAYGKIHETREIVRTNVVCQRENSFYVDTVRQFRDRRYEYKAALKTWKKKLEAAKSPDEVKLCQSRCIQMESLQLAHKCILNSFYGYVMRKGSRWYSIEMAGIVTYCGASLIQMARAFMQEIGITLELDTDGIWCCLPCTFPQNFVFTTSNPQKPRVAVSYLCALFNKMVGDRYSNDQYQALVRPGVYETRKECTIYFELDGPYHAMLLPASREEGKSIKKRYAVFNSDGQIAELKGFELKRRGELMLIKDFQSQVFSRFLDGDSLQGAYAAAAAVANVALDMLESKGEGYEVEEILEKITESSNMTRRLSEYPENQKSLAITTARRIAEFLGPQMVKDKGLACQFIISRLPISRSVTERAIPVTIFRAEPAVRTHFLRKWTGDASLPSEIDLRSLLDWEYYTTRFNACVQKIITIPAALQFIPNPVPRVPHPDWLQKRVRQQDSRFRQLSLSGLFDKKGSNEKLKSMRNNSHNEEDDGEGEAGLITEDAPSEAGLKVTVELQDVEDLAGRANGKSKSKGSTSATRKQEHIVGDSDWEDEDGDGSCISSEDDLERIRREQEALEEVAVQTLKEKYFSPKSSKIIDTSFFTDPGMPAWLKAQKQAWVHRARLRKELMQQGDEAAAQFSLDTAQRTRMGHFIDLKSRALSTMWNVLEVREQPDDQDTVLVLAALGSILCTFRVQVPRRVIVDMDPRAPPLSYEDGSVVEVSNRILPRNRPRGRQYQVTLQPGPAGERRLNEISITEGVRQLYEAHITRVDHLIETLGCCADVDTALYLENAKTRPPSQRDVFRLEELTMSSSTRYLDKLMERVVFIFHVAADTRGVLAFVNPQSGVATVVFVQPAAAAPPSVNWTALREEAMKHMGLPAKGELSIHTETVSDIASGWRVVHQALSEAIESPGKSPVLAVLESSQSTSQLLLQRALPANVPYLRLMGASEDEKLFTDPFRWARLLGRRMLHRYYASTLWVEQRVALSRISGIPVCNLAQDSCVHVLDVLYTRALHRRSHVMWCSSDPSIAFDTIEERSREVVMPGGYTSWCVEFSLSRLDMAAILFSQMIQEGIDPSTQALCDKGVSSHFNILRDLVADVLSQAVHNSIADNLLSNVTRWIRDPVSACYEPRLVETLNNLSHRALTMVLLRLAKLGGRTVRVDSASITIVTPKYSIQEAASFARFVTNSLHDQPMLVLLALQPVRYWHQLVLLNKRDFAGLYVDATNDEVFRLEDTQSLSEEPHKGSSLLQHLKLEQTYMIHGRLPQNLKRRMEECLGSLFWRLASIMEQVKSDLRSETTVALVTRGEDIHARLVRRFQKFFEAEVQPELIAEVDAVRESRELYTEEEREAAASGTAGGLSLGSPALYSSEMLALEYAKYVCCVLEHIPCHDVVSKMRNNCLRLCNVSPFSPQAFLEVDPLSFIRIQSITCSFCNAYVSIDLCGKPKAGVITCPGCHTAIAASGLEARLVREVNQMLMQYVQQDFVCLRCKEMATTYLCDNCCGPLVGKEKSILNYLKALKVIANLRGFTLLDEILDAAIMAT